MKGMFQNDSPLMKFMVWLSDMLQVQLLWVVYTILGLGLAGFFPSTIAMFSIMRNLVYKKESDHFSKRFKEEYKANFIRGNILGYLLIGISILLILYFKMTFNIDSIFSTIFVFLGYALFILFGILTLYIFPVYTHFELSLWEVIRHSAVFMVSVPMMTLMMVLIVIVFVVTFERLLILVPFVSIAILAYGLTYFAQLSFKAITQTTTDF